MGRIDDPPRGAAELRRRGAAYRSDRQRPLRLRRDRQRQDDAVAWNPILADALAGATARRRQAPPTRSGGTVKLWVPAAGYGIVVADDGAEVYVSARLLARARVEIAKGDRVFIEYATGIRGPFCCYIRPE
jgi:cold shock CspA family protein